MPDYSLGKIYKIISNQTDKIYIGSTIQKYLSDRLGGHNYEYKRFLSGEKKYISSFDLMKYEDHKIILLENFPCNTKEELLAREQYYIDMNKNICVNNQCAQRDSKKYYQDNKERIKEKVKVYAENNKEMIAQKKKQYREQKKQEINERKKHYYQENKDEILQKQKEKIKCNICNKEIRKGGMARHIRNIHEEF